MSRQGPPPEPHEIEPRRRPPRTPVPQPVLSASGCLATGHDVPGLVDLRQARRRRDAEPDVRTVEGMGDPALGRDPVRAAHGRRATEPGRAGLRRRGPAEARQGGGAPVVASVAGASLGEYVNVASTVHLKPGVVALEVCVSCPDDEREGEPFYARPERLTEIVGAVARLSRVPVFAKLPPPAPRARRDRPGVCPGRRLRSHADRRGPGARRRPSAAADADGDAGRAASRAPRSSRWPSPRSTRCRGAPERARDGRRGHRDRRRTRSSSCSPARGRSRSAPRCWSTRRSTSTSRRGSWRYLSEKGFASPDELRGRVRVRDAANGSP